MTPFARALFVYGNALTATERAYLLGTPEAIADCQRRVREAQIAAHAALTAPDRDQEIADRLVNGAASDGYDELIPDYDTASEEDEI